MLIYELYHKEYIVLSFWLDHHMPSVTDANLVYTELEAHYQSIINKLTNIPRKKLSHLKIKYKDKKIINKLSKNPKITLLLQDKDKSMVIMDKGKKQENYPHTQQQRTL